PLQPQRADEPVDDDGVQAHRLVDRSAAAGRTDEAVRHPRARGRRGGQGPVGVAAARLDPERRAAAASAAVDRRTRGQVMTAVAAMRGRLRPVDTRSPAAGRRPRRGPRMLLVCLMLLVAGCGDGGFSGLYNAPLPGGADLGDHPYRVTVRFEDVLDLVPQAAVKVNDVAVGRVERVRLAPDGRSALVDLAVSGDVRLPADASAELRQSSMLGEKFVELSPPQQGGRGTLAEGAVIPLDRTNRNPEVEEVLGALSLLLNGGGVQQLRDIVGELNEALTGNAPEIKALLSRVDHLASTLDEQRGDIVRAIDGVHALSRTLSTQRGDLATALEHLEP